MYYCPLIKEECAGESCVLYGAADEIGVCDFTVAVREFFGLRETTAKIVEELKRYVERSIF